MTGGHVVLSHAQAVEVAKRFNPSAGRTLWFADNGTLLSEPEAHRAVAARPGAAYVCRRPAIGGVVEVARVTWSDVAAGIEPAFAVPW
jgi:hypothetical protein